MIPLTDIDHAAILAGAYVPVVDCSPGHPDDEWTWCGDFLLRINRTERDPGGDRPPWFRDLFEGDAAGHLDLALDPTDPTVAALLDRRIAEAMEFRGVAFALATGYPHEECGLYMVAITQGVEENGPPARRYEVSLKGLHYQGAPVAARLAEMRALLIRALYPRKES